MKKFAKSDLRDGDLVLCDNEELRIVNGNKLFDCLESVISLDYYSEELRHDESKELNIIAVYLSIWEREEPTITADEKIILRNVDSKYKYIARDEDETLCIYINKPAKSKDYWLASSSPESLNSFRHLFKMVKWEDEEPWLIEDLLNLPVKEN